jgi:type I restriction enzyme S subunit
VNKGNELPVGWAWTALAEVASVNPRVDVTALADTVPVTFIPMQAMGAGTGRVDVTNERLLSTVKRGYTAFQNGDVLFAKITPCMENGKAAVARSLVSGIGFGSTEFHVLRPGADVDAEYLYYFVSQESFRHSARERMTGTAGQLRVPASYMAQVRLPLAPLAEQHRIVATIEQQFTRLDAGVAALRRVRAALKRYRAAVLKAAVEGKLTEAWRAEHPNVEPAAALLARILAERRARWEADLRAKGKDPAKARYEEPAAPDTAGLPALPDGWCWVSLGAVSDIHLGKMLSPKAYAVGLLQLPYLRNENVRWSAFNLTDVKYMGFKLSEVDRYRVEPMDLMVCEGGEAGRCAVYAGTSHEYMYQKALHRVRAFRNFASPYYIQTCLQHYVAAKTVIPRPSETTIQHLPLEKMMTLPLPAPSLAEQKQIVAEVDRRLSVVSELEANVEANLKRAERLRQSILERAFSGRLVPQDPNDEPASMLLERIRIQRGGGKTTQHSPTATLEPVGKIPVQGSIW